MDRRYQPDRIGRDDIRAGKLAELDREMLAKFVHYGRPAAVHELFQGFEPKWATDAVSRLLGCGFVTADSDGRYEVTADGAWWLKSGRRGGNGNAGGNTGRKAAC